MNSIKDIVRYIVTIGIWGGLIVPLGMVASADNPNVAQAFTAFFAFAMAVVMTFFIWDGSKIILASMGYYEHDDESKRKNANQNADAALLLLELLSDDERRNIRQRLVRGNDGELPQIFANEEETESSERY